MERNAPFFSFYWSIMQIIQADISHAKVAASLLGQHYTIANERMKTKAYIIRGIILLLT